mgnify:FL=1
MALKQDVLDRISGDPVLCGKVAKCLGKSNRTIERYISENNSDLTKYAVLVLLKNETGVKDMNLLIESK